MQLGQILERARLSNAPTLSRKIQFRVIAFGSNGEKRLEDATAALCFVSDDARRQHLRDAQKALFAFYGEQPIPAAALDNEVTYYLLAEALRDGDDERKQFAPSPELLRKVLEREEVEKIVTAYRRFVAEEMPEQIDAAEMEKLCKEAEGKSLAVLLSSFASSTERAAFFRALPSLVRRFSR